MERSILQDLLKWKQSKHRKPLILNGARQVGKTWVLRHFGEVAYKNVAYINCDREPRMATLFTDFDVQRILKAIEVITQVPVVAGQTLIIIDEVQEVPRAIQALKYFCEDAADQHIAVAGSLLGIMLHEGISFPVGKVNTMQMYPLSFAEFLKATGKDAFVKVLEEQDWPTAAVIHEQLLDCLRHYFYVGGMPEIVQAYIDGEPMWTIRDMQNEILNNYIQDIGKHAPPREVMRISMVFRSIPGQLSKENKKFVYGVVKEGARAREFEIALQWLCDAGLVYRVNRVSKPEAPLQYYEDFSAFKLFVLDCGLLGAMSNTSADSVVIGDGVFEEYRGAFTEQYVLQELKAKSELPIFYYSKENSRQEIDFLVQCGQHVIPVEAKSGKNLQSKSFGSFCKEHNPEVAVKTSLLPFKQNSTIINLPLYAVRAWFDGKEN
jgi:predicted AAA+ superfamily ATPase